MKLFLNAKEKLKIDTYDQLEKDYGVALTKISKLETIIKDLMKAAAGCQKHPAYRGIHKPTAGCSTCVNIHNAITLLDVSHIDPFAGRIRKKKVLG